MGAGGLIAALAGGAALGYVILRRQDQSKATAPAAPTGGTSPCDALPAGVARDTCKGAQGVLGIVKGIGNLIGSGQNLPKQAAENDARNQQNSALNGPVELELSFAASHCVGPGKPEGQTNAEFGNTWPALIRINAPSVNPSATVLRYANGCEPFKDAPGWKKCAPGTQALGGGRSVLTGRINYGLLKTGDYDARGNSSDPLSGYFLPVKNVYSQSATGHAYPNGGRCEGSFPIPIPEGHVAYFYKGRPFTCPQGTRPDFSIADHRANAVPPPCLKPGDKSRAELAAGDGGGAVIDAALLQQRNDQGGTGTRTTVGDPATDPNFIFDPTIGAWRRRRAGE